MTRVMSDSREADLSDSGCNPCTKTFGAGNVGQADLVNHAKGKKNKTEVVFCACVCLS